MRIRIETEEGAGGHGGIPGHSVHVYDAETGETIPGVYKAEWSAEVGELITCRLWFRDVEIMADGDDISELGEKYWKTKVGTAHPRESLPWRTNEQSKS